MTEIATRTQDPMGAFTPEDEQLVAYLGLNPRDPKSRAVVAVCRRYSFDPVLKHVIVIPKGGVYITRDGLLNAAHRSGQFDGMVVEQDPTLDEAAGEWVAKVSVYRKDMRFPFTYPGRYPAKGGNQQYAPEMALKCAEAHALRRAFDITGLPTLDEQKADDARRPSRPAPTPQFTQQRPEPAPEQPRPQEQQPVDVSDAEVVEDEPDDPAAARITDTQRRAMLASFSEAGFDTDARSAEGKAARLAYIGKTIGREIESTNDLTQDEASLVIDALKTDAQGQDEDPWQGGDAS